ncbi:MAG: glucuronate isomerase [Planctomycetaceae bacterium]
MSDSLKMRLFDELEAFPLIDPHTHINPHAAASKTLADILGYHYYTELAHSAGLSREVIEEPEISPGQGVSRPSRLETIQNTAQYAWLLDICRDFFGFQGEHLTTHNWEALYDLAEAKMSAPDWEQQVLRQSRLDQVYLTNDFDDRLEGFDTSFYVPCLRTDDLVFHLAKPEVRQRLQVATNRELGTVEDLRASIRQLFEHFSARGARACAISLPPDFSPAEVPEGDVSAMWLRLVHGAAVSAEETVLLSRYVFWELARNCEEFQLPFDLMIGVNRRVYPALRVPGAGFVRSADLPDSISGPVQCVSTGEVSDLRAGKQQ